MKEGVYALVDVSLHLKYFENNRANTVIIAFLKGL